MTIVERAARAAMDEVSRQTDGNWPADETGLVALVDYHLDFSDLARAVLQAIREPTSDMADLVCRLRDDSALCKQRSIECRKIRDTSGWMLASQIADDLDEAAYFLSRDSALTE
jgi:hypothetical protein